MNELALSNPLLYIVIVVILSGVWLCRWLFKQTIAAQVQRADDWKAIADTYRTSVETLLHRLDATTVVAETANKVLTAIPLPEEAK